MPLRARLQHLVLLRRTYARTYWAASRRTLMLGLPSQRAHWRAQAQGSMMTKPTDRWRNQSSNCECVNRWVSTIRHCSSTTAIWKADLAKSTAKVVACTSDTFRLEIWPPCQ